MGPLSGVAVGDIVVGLSWVLASVGGTNWAHIQICRGFAICLLGSKRKNHHPCQ